MKAPPTVKELLAMLYERFPEFFEKPPKREWVEMEWEDIQKARQKCGSMVEAMQYINDWLKEKNHD